MFRLVLLSLCLALSSLSCDDSSDSSNDDQSALDIQDQVDASDLEQVRDLSDSSDLDESDQASATDQEAHPEVDAEPDAERDQGLDADEDEGPDVEETGCDIDGFDFDQDRTQYSPEDEVVFIDFFEKDLDMLSVEVYFTEGAEVGAKTVTLGQGLEANYETCAYCVVLYRADNDGNGEPDQHFFASSGSLEFTQLVEDTGAVVIRDLELVEVTFDPETWVSTPVLGGQTWCIERLESTQ